MKTDRDCERELDAAKARVSAAIRIGASPSEAELIAEIRSRYLPDSAPGLAADRLELLSAESERLKRLEARVEWMLHQSRVLGVGDGCPPEVKENSIRMCEELLDDSVDGTNALAGITDKRRPLSKQPKMLLFEMEYNAANRRAVARRIGKKRGLADEAEVRSWVLDTIGALMMEALFR